MMNTIFFQPLTVLLFGLLVVTGGHAQTTLYRMEGVVRSVNGSPVSQATVSIYEGQKLLATCPTNDRGAYLSDKIFKKNQSVTVTVSTPGFVDKSAAHKVVAGENTVDLLLTPRTFISGFVVDSVRLEPVKDADVSFYDKDGRLIKSVKTNSEGYFDFETEFTFGEIILIRVSKGLYFPREKRLRIVKPEREENRVEFRLPKIEDTGIKVNIRVFDLKTGNPIEGANIRYAERGKPKELMTPANGELNLNIFQPSGSRLNLRIQKPKYLELAPSPTLAADGNSFDFTMERQYRFPWCACLFGAGGASVVTGGVFFASSRKAFKDFKDAVNTEREEDYARANKQLKTAAIFGGAGVLLIGGGFLCNHVENKNEQLPKKSTSPIKPYGYMDLFGNPQLGIAYTFNHQN